MAVYLGRRLGQHSRGSGLDALRTLEALLPCQPSKFSTALFTKPGLLECGMNRERTIREEANALTCYAFRNGKLEGLHAGMHSELLENPGLSRITDVEMKELMIEASAKLAQALLWRESDSDRYWRLIDCMCDTYAKNWIKDEPSSTPEASSEDIAKDPLFDKHGRQGPPG